MGFAKGEWRKDHEAGGTEGIGKKVINMTDGVSRLHGKEKGLEVLMKSRDECLE